MRKWWVVAALLVAVGLAALVWRTREVPGPAAPRPASAPRPDFERLEVRAEPGEEGLTLEGRVLDARGAPVPGAQVHLVAGEQARLASLRCSENEALLLACTSPESPTVVAELLAEGQGLLEPAASETADAEGRFRFEHLRGVSFTVWASGAGHGTALQDRAAPGERVELYLPPLRSIEGRVVDESGQSIGDARVWAVSRKLSLAEEVRADATGRFLFEGLGEGPFYVVAAAEGYLAAAELGVEAGPRVLELKLLRPRELVVRVFKDGEPAEATVVVESNHLHRRVEAKKGVARLGGMGRRRIMVRAQAGSAASVPTTVTLGEERTEVSVHLVEGGTLWVTAVDGEGQPVPNPKLGLYVDGGPLVQEVTAGTGEPVALGPVGPGDYVLVGEAQGFKPVDLPVRIRPGESPFELVMQRGTMISGRVLDLYGRGASGIQVLVQPTGESARADAQGAFSVLVPSPGAYTLQAHHSDWGGVDQQVSAPAEGVELSLEPGASLKVIVSANGRRVEGASVRAWSGTETIFTSDSLSGPDGVVWMRGMPPETFNVIAEHPDFLMGEPERATVGEAQEVTVEVTLREGATLEGEAVDTQGAPVADVTVLLSSQEPVRTDANGRFTAKGLVPGRKLWLNAAHPDYDLTERVNVEVVAGKVAKAKLVLERRGSYRGRVVAADGKALTSFRVENREFTDPSGRFEISAQARPWQNGKAILLSVEAQGYLPEALDFPATQFDLGTIELQPAPKFTGRVVDEDRSGVGSAVVSCLECDRRTLTADDGSFELDLPGFEGSMTLTASKGSMTAEQEVSTSARSAELVLKRKSALSGAYYDASGVPRGGVALVISSSALMNSEVVVTGADGSFRYEASPGPIRVTVARSPDEDTSASVMQLVQLEEGGTTLALGRAPGTSRLTVTVPARNGWLVALVRGDFQPEAQLLTRLMDQQWAQVAGLGGRSLSASGGQVVFGSLTPGRYTVVFGRAYAHSQLEEVVRPVEIRGDQAITIEAPARAEH